MQSVGYAAPGYRPAPRVQSVATPPAAQTATSSAAAPLSGPVLDLIPNQDHLARLAKIGLASPGRLSFWTAGGVRRFLVSMLTGVGQQDLIRYGQRADLMRIPNMKPQWAYVLESVGVKGPADLAQYRGDDFAVKVQRGIFFGTVVAKSVELAANEGRIYEPPNFTQLENLINGSVGLGNRIRA